MKKITNNAMDNLSVCWELTTTCNYACWYCDPKLHDGRYKWPDLEIALDFFEHLSLKYNTIHVDMVGGEPTLWPGLTEFIERKPKNVFVLVSTNGSRTIKWWERNWPFIEGTCISFHSDSANVDHIYNVVSTIVDKKYLQKYVQVNILAYDEKLDSCLDLYERLLASNYPVDCRIKAVDARYKKDDRIDRSRNDDRIKETIKNKQFYRGQGADKIGKPTMLFVDDEPVSFQEMFLWKFDKVSNFKGWKCSAGKSRLYIEANGDIFRGSCKNDGVIGNMFIDTNLSANFTICKNNLCGCGDELILEKYKI